MSRRASLLLVIVVWAAVYLPSLGLFEIRGEEGRRILPGIAMLESGNFLVPQVGGEDYFRKPPLINWAVAASFKIFHARNEWTARVPSVLAILIAAIVFVTAARRALGPTGSLVAALVWLTNIALLQKGRLIEIEALYVSLTALAVVLWLSWWEEQRSPWLTWIVPWVFLGLGWLAKGPTHLFFFYAVVLAVLCPTVRQSGGPDPMVRQSGGPDPIVRQSGGPDPIVRQSGGPSQTGRWRMLWHPAHVVGILLMLGIFGAWALPLLQVSRGHHVVDRWSTQFTGRVTGDFFTFGSWITILPRALAYLLPWILFVPLARPGNFSNPEKAKMARALLWSIFVPLTLVSLIPGSAPRYSIPVVPAFAWLLGMACAEDALSLPAGLPPAIARLIGRAGKLDWRRWTVVFVILAMLAGLVGYPVASVIAKRRPKVRNIAAAIDRVIPQGERIYAVDPNYQPFFFYLRAPVTYVSSMEELPWETRYFLVRPAAEGQAREEQKWFPRRTRELTRVKDYRDQTVVVFAVDPG